jgi:DNA-binding protein
VAVSRPPNIIFIGKKSIMTYVNATLTLLANEPVVTIKARGKSITAAVDVSQMIVKRLNAVGYKVSDVRIFSERMTSLDGKERNVSTIEIDISRP